MEKPVIFQRKVLEWRLVDNGKSTMRKDKEQFMDKRCAIQIMKSTV